MTQIIRLAFFFFFFLTGFREFQGVGVISLHWSKNLQEWANVVKC